MKQCERDRTPCLHAPCCDAQGVKCCGECPDAKSCTTACFKAREGEI